MIAFRKTYVIMIVDGFLKDKSDHENSLKGLN